MTLDGTPEPVAAWAPIPFQQLDMLEHLIAALDWDGMDSSHVTLALGLAARLEHAAHIRIAELYAKAVLVDVQDALATPR